MWIVLREWASPENCIGVFDTEKKALAYVSACKKCHAQNTYKYRVQRVGYNLLCD